MQLGATMASVGLHSLLRSSRVRNCAVATSLIPQSACDLVTTLSESTAAHPSLFRDCSAIDPTARCAVRYGESEGQFLRRPESLGPSVSRHSTGVASSPLAKTPHKAGVIRHARLVATLSTDIDMASQSGRPAAGDGAHDLELLEAEPVSMSLAELVRLGAKDVGHLDGGPAHRFFSFRERLASAGTGQRQLLDRVGDGVQMPLREMQVDGGVAEVGVTEQDLNGTQVRAGLQQMGGEAVATMPHAA